MANNDKEKESQAWLAFASAAIAGYQVPEDDEDIEDFDSMLDDMVETATGVADQMVQEFAARYMSKSTAPRSRSNGRGRRAAAEDDE